MERERKRGTEKDREKDTGRQMGVGGGEEEEGAFIYTLVSHCSLWLISHTEFCHTHFNPYTSRLQIVKINTAITRDMWDCCTSLLYDREKESAPADPAAGLELCAGRSRKQPGHRRVEETSGWLHPPYPFSCAG